MDVTITNRSEPLFCIRPIPRLWNQEATPLIKDLISEAAFFLKDPLKINDFRNDLYKTTIQLRGYLLNADDAVYEKKVLPLTFTKSLIEQPGRLVLVIGLILSVILVLISSFSKKKTGSVLRVMGLDSRKTFRFMVSEVTLLVLCAICFVDGSNHSFHTPVADEPSYDNRCRIASNRLIGAGCNRENIMVEAC